uniref:Uncharacterized protein n=1 Tax=Sander lucioperca TaxID=283035 RepID=A0A8C9XFM3_SANLU
GEKCINGVYKLQLSVSKWNRFHCLWDCNKIKDFWKEVAQMIFQIVSVKLPLPPKVFILGLYPADPNLKCPYYGKKKHFFWDLGSYFVSLVLPHVNKLGKQPSMLF